MLFRLKAGQHEGYDYSKDPVTVTNTDGSTQEEYPKRLFNQGELIDSGHVDLAGMLGANKFELVDPDKTALKKSKKGVVGGGEGGMDKVPPPMVTPHGQVTAGFQQTSGGVTGGMNQQDLERAGLLETAMKSPKPSDMGSLTGKQKSAINEKGSTEGTSKAESKGEKESLADKYYLDEMTVEQLKEVAEDEEVDLGSAKKKDDILKVLKEW